MYQTLSESFLRIMDKYLHWDAVFAYQNISYDFILNNMSHLEKIQLLEMNKHLSFSEEQWNTLWEYLKKKESK